MIQDPHRPMDERLKTYAKLWDEHGTLSLVSVEDSKALEVTLAMKSKRGNFRLTVKSSEAQPMRASSVTFAMLEHR
jgi:hypothetical protein